VQELPGEYSSYPTFGIILDIVTCRLYSELHGEAGTLPSGSLAGKCAIPCRLNILIPENDRNTIKDHHFVCRARQMALRIMSPWLSNLYLRPIYAEHLALWASGHVSLMSP
jgi:hypothetical protein